MVDGNAAPGPQDAARTVPRWVWICTGMVVAGVVAAVISPSVFSSETTGVVISALAATVAVLSVFAIAAWGLGILFYEATKNG
jgi:hypothetical protein